MSDPIAIAATTLPPESLTQMGILGVVLLFLIKELFSYLKSKKDGNSADALSSSGNDTSTLILKELQRMNDNHLHTIQESNERLVDVMRDGNMKIVELLGEIKGNLNQRLK